MTDERHSTETWALALETSGPMGGIALGRGDEVVAELPLDSGRRHAAGLLPAIEGACQSCNVAPSAIRRVYLSAGPGSFTGLRIAFTVARMLAMTNKASVVAVPSLEVIAQNAAETPDPPTRVVVLRDAKRSRVYAASFVHREGVYTSVEEAAEVDPAAFLAAQDRPCGILGEGLEPHRRAIEESGLTILPEDLGVSRARVVYRLGLGRAEHGLFAVRRELIPTYVRRPEPEEKWERRHRAGRDT